MLRLYCVQRLLFLHLTCIYAIEAVHRFYESRRRLFNDDQPSRRDKAEELKKKCKKIGYQKKVMCLHNQLYLFLQLYVSRKKFLKNEQESEKWSQIDFQYT